jgi:hypothetical protein
LFITVLLPKKAQTSKIGDLAKKYQFGWYNLSNQITQQLEGDYSYFCTTGAMCDCETLIGSGSRRGKGNISEIDSARFKRRGWDDSKISRWLDQRSAIRNPPMDDRDEIQKWIEFVTEVLVLRLASNVGILIHFYSKSVNDESFELLESANQSPLSTEYLLNIDQNRVHFLIALPFHKSTIQDV